MARTTAVTRAACVAGVQGTAAGAETTANGRVPVSAEVPGATARTAAGPRLEGRTPPTIVIRGGAGTPPGSVPSEVTEGRTGGALAQPDTQIRLKATARAKRAGTASAKGQRPTAPSLADTGSSVPVAVLP